MVLALEVVDVLVVRVEALGRTLERPAAYRVIAQEVGVLRGAFPLAGVRRDGVAYLGEGRRVGTPDANSGVDLAGREVQVESGRVGGLSRLVAEVHRRLRLVRTLVLREPHVAVDAEHRASVGPRVRYEPRADGVQARLEVLNEPQQRFLNVQLVTALVGLEPLTVVVRPQLEQELEELRGEVCL